MDAGAGHPTMLAHPGRQRWTIMGAVVHRHGRSGRHAVITIAWPSSGPPVVSGVGRTAGRPESAKEQRMRVVVNWDLCESNALCMGIAPEVFEVREDDNLYILQEQPDESLRPKVEQAVRMCPKQAISIEDD